MNVRFVVTKPVSKATTFSVRLPLLVGRSEEARFRIQQDRVSRKHCEFFEQDGGVYLRDLGSTNGTFLNGELIETSAKVPLEPGAIVQVGSLEFRVEFVAEATATPMPPFVDVDASDKTVGLSQAADSEHLKIEPPADEPPTNLTAERPAPADDAFGFLGGADDDTESKPDNDRLGDFLKGLQ